jgi:DNA-binding MarR family transcriptional regulator
MGIKRPAIGALTRMPYQAARAALVEDLRAAGFADLNAAHLNVFQYPGPEGAQPGVLAERALMSKQAMNHLLGQLETKGYLRRAENSRGGDGRQRVVHLSHAGGQPRRSSVAASSASNETGDADSAPTSTTGCAKTSSPSTGCSDPTSKGSRSQAAASARTTDCREHASIARNRTRKSWLRVRLERLVGQSVRQKRANPVGRAAPPPQVARGGLPSSAMVTR